MVDPSNTPSILVQPTDDLSADLLFLTDTLGFRLLEIYPSDDPAVALLSGCGVNIRLDRTSEAAAAILEISEDLLSGTELPSDTKELSAPNGMRVRVQHRQTEMDLPVTQHRFEIRRLRDSDSWVVGRAGMQYRDLIPDRLGGSIIASHIRIPDGGPVPDMVHYHTIGFQLIYCYRGWVKLVYEDQGPPFILNAGDCVTQPPQIRHRVLEASDNLEVVEIAVPAEHMTTIDHEMTLPNDRIDHERLFQGQTFCHHRSDQAIWASIWESNQGHETKPGWLCSDTGVSASSNAVADVQVIRPDVSAIESSDQVLQTLRYKHNADIYFVFVLDGQVKIETEQGSGELNAGDAFVLPPQMPLALSDISSDLELLQVMLPGSSLFELV